MLFVIAVSGRKVLLRRYPAIDADEPNENEWRNRLLLEHYADEDTENVPDEGDYALVSIELNPGQLETRVRWAALPGRWQREIGDGVMH